MGSPPDETGRSADEGPQIQVRVAPMWVGKHEVTQAEYREFEQLATERGKQLIWGRHMIPGAPLAWIWSWSAGQTKSRCRCSMAAAPTAVR